jgi:hypothetical protein
MTRLPFASTKYEPEPELKLKPDLTGKLDTSAQDECTHSASKIQIALTRLDLQKDGGQNRDTASAPLSPTVQRTCIFICWRCWRASLPIAVDCSWAPAARPSP